MFNAKISAYWLIRNYICSQIAHEKENENREDLINAYQTILDILTNNKGKIIK